MRSIFYRVRDLREQKLLANTIVTSVFMGLVQERLGNNLNVKIGYGAGYAADNDPLNRGPKEIKREDKVLHDELKRLLVDKFAKLDTKNLVVGPADKWVDASKKKEGRPIDVDSSSWAITGTGKLKGLQGSVEMGTDAKQRALDCLSNNFIKGTGKEGAQLKDTSVSEERGAYYGIADCDNGQVYGPISTTRQIIKDEERWLDAPGHGWIGGGIGTISNAGMSDTEDERLIKKFPGPTEYVIGYCHGMIFAEHIVFMSGGGSAYEISMNMATCKNASCFGCSSFMFANGMPPSWMHIGSAESWVPLPETKSGFAYAGFPEFKGTETCAARARDMNAAWAGSVRAWMTQGAKLLPGGNAKALLTEALATRDLTDRQAANWFLDALTIHGADDVWRIVQVLRNTGYTVPPDLKKSPDADPLGGA